MAAANEPQPNLPREASAGTPATEVPSPAPAVTGITADAPAGPTPPLTAVTAEAPPPREASIPLPPLQVKRTPLTPERLAAEIKVLDRIVVGLVLVLSFLLASFAIQNSDFWMHLASGRLLAQGDYTFGTNPYSHPATGYWANHAWLFDWAVYGLSLLGGGIDSAAGQALLVVVKALLATCLAWVLLSMRRPGQSLWVPALCTTLALLTLSPGLVFQPRCLSLLFLGLTFFLLQRSGTRVEGQTTAGPGGSKWRWAWALVRTHPAWLLPPLFVLWVNVDDWFILGPVTVSLYLLGEALQHFLLPIRSGPDARAPGHLRTLALVFGVGWLACLINPYGYRAFTPPAELSYLLVQAADTLSIDPPDQLVAAGRTLDTLGAASSSGFHSPLTAAQVFQPGYGLSMAGVAYFVLVLTGLASFALNLGVWPLGRLLVWLDFAVLSFLQARNIPFFAVVAGPITALNLQDLIARRFGTQARTDGYWKVWSLSGRLVSVVLGLVLLFFAWPGLLHWRSDNPRFSRHVAWRVDADPLMLRTVRQLRRLHEWAPPGHAFNFSPEMANYCAWFCPGQKTFFDYRFGLFSDRADTYYRVRRSLANPAEPFWRDLFRTHHIDRVIMGNEPLAQAVNALYWLWINPDQWPQPALGELSTIFGWHDPDGGRASPFRRRRLNLDALAFRPGTRNRAPDTGPREPEETTFLSRFRRGPVPAPEDAHEAGLYLTYYEAVGMRKAPSVYLNSYLLASQVAAGCSAATGLGTGGALYGPVATSYALDGLPMSILRAPYRTLKLTDQFVPHAPLLLAVRASRRAVAACPDDPGSYLALARAYRQLWKTQEEAWAFIALAGAHRALGVGEATAQRVRRIVTIDSFQRLDQAYWQTLRLVQTVSALHHALTVQPELVEAHRMLKDLYLQLHYLDTALEHAEKELKYSEARAPVRRPTETDDNFEQRQEDFRKSLEGLEGQVKQLRANVNERRKDYKLQALNQSLQNKIALALFLEYRQEKDLAGRGLANEALNLLLKAKAADMDYDKAIRQLQLLLTMGRTRQVEEGLRDLAQGLRRDEKKHKGRPGFLQHQRRVELALTWIGALLAGARGDYAKADKLLVKFQGRTRVDPQFLAFLPCYFFMQGLSVAPMPSTGPLTRLMMTTSHQRQLQEGLRSMLEPLRSQAEFDLLRGLLALEHGDPRQAAKHFRSTLATSQDLIGPSTIYPARAVAEQYLRLIEREEQKGRK